MTEMKKGAIGAMIASEKFEEKLEKLNKEKYSSRLKELGKKSAFKEEFEGIKLEDQEFPRIPTIDNIVENEYFIEGRKFGFTLIANGFTAENYNSYNERNKTKKHR